MRGTDQQQSSIFNYISAELQVAKDHPLRAIRTMADTALEELSPTFGRLYAVDGRPSIAPEKLLRALLLQVLYTVRSERQLMEQLDYNLLFRWFVGLSMDEPVWDVTVFTKNRERLLAGAVAQALFNAVLSQAHTHGLLSGEHFTVDGTLIEAYASAKSFQPKADAEPPASRPMARATLVWTSMASGAVTPPTNRPPTPRRGCTRRARGARPSSAIWGTSQWRIATAWRSTRA
jgi:transposase